MTLLLQDLRCIWHSTEQNSVIMYLGHSVHSPLPATVVFCPPLVGPVALSAATIGLT